jgi:signal transduction histidine kinase
MFSGLRVRLTGLFLLATVVVVTVAGGGAYVLVRTYFQSMTDLALQHRMADEFAGLAAPVPPELMDAERAWYARRPPTAPLLTPTGDQRAGGSAPGRPEPSGSDVDDAYDGELAAIFVLPLGADATLLFDPNASPAPMAPDQPAAAAALAHGSDWRDVRLDDGTRVRLLTYRLTRADGPALVQVGRMLTDQDRVLSELLLGLLGLGCIAVGLLGLGSWWLAGRALRPAQRAWEGQQVFIANASHELRAPLTLIRASTEVVLDDLPAGDSRRRELADVMAECDHMGRLVGDLLLLSRMDAGQLPMTRAAVLLTDLLQEVRRQVGHLATERAITLVVDSAPCAAWADPARLRQVLLILLDNALRHTPAGGQIRLACESLGSRARLTVADTGEGIPADFLPHVFERFARAVSSRDDRDSGSGLGLAIARGLVEAQHGQIEIASRPGEGTRVTVTLPAAALPAATATGARTDAAPPHPVGSGRVK